MLKILIADDQLEVRELMEVTLRSEGVKILKAASGEEAINIARIEKPDLIIMDIMMPGKMDGLEATRILKKDEQTKKIAILMLSAKGQKSDIKKGLDAGAIGYFTKPFSPLELIEKVEELIKGKSLGL